MNILFAMALHLLTAITLQQDFQGVYTPVNIGTFGDDGNYETDSASWGFAALGNRSSDYSTRGAYSFKYIVPSAGDGSTPFLLAEQQYAGDDGKTYTAYAKIRTSSAFFPTDLPAASYFKIGYGAFTGTELSVVTKTASDGFDTWVEIKTQWIQNAGSGSHPVGLYMYPNGGFGQVGAPVYIDEFYIFEDDATPPPSLYNSGDRILVYYDDVNTSSVSDDGYLVQHESNPGGELTTISTGPLVIISDPRNQVTNVNFPRDPGNGGVQPSEINTDKKCDYQFCGDVTGDTLVYFRLRLTDDSYVSSFPYVDRYLIPNSPVCSVAPIVCNTQFTIEPIVTPCTNNYSNDGTVQIQAEGGHGPCLYVEYDPHQTNQLGQFNNLFGTPGSVTTGLFENLSPSTHKFLAFDFYGCGATIDVVVPVDISTVYNPKYRLQYFDTMTNTQTVIEIWERSYLGDVSDVTGTDEPAVVSKDHGALNDKFEIIHGTTVAFNLISRKHFQFIGLAQQDDEKYMIVFTHGVTTGKWFVPPSIYSESYSPTVNYPVTITGGDGIKNVSAVPFTDPNGNYLTGFNLSGDRSLMYIISTILKNTHLKLDIVSAINKYAEGQLNGAADDPLTQTYIDCLTFYDQEDGTPQSSDVVLEAILRPFGAKIIQQDGQWRVVEIDAQTAPYKYRRFDYKGTYIDNGTINPIVDVIAPSTPLTGIVFSESDHNLDINPAYGIITIKHNLIARKSIFPVSIYDWQFNSVGSQAYKGLTFVAGSSVRGLEIFNLTNDFVSIYSPVFQVATLTDSINISFDYLTSLIRSNLDPRPDPPWTRINWRLLMTVGSEQFYYSELIGWTKYTPVAVSNDTKTIPTSHPTTLSFVIFSTAQFPQNSQLKFVNGGNYFRAYVQSYISGVLTVVSYANSGTGTFSNWDIYNGGPDFINNNIYSTSFDDKFQSFSKKIDLPEFIVKTTIRLQLQIVAAGSSYTDFNSIAGLKAMSTSVLPVGSLVRGPNPNQIAYPGGLVWYKLRAGTDANSGASVGPPYSHQIVRGDDFNATTNAVVWERYNSGLNTGIITYDYATFVNKIDTIQIQKAVVEFLPNGQTAPSVETITYTNNIKFKENLPVEINTGDIPVSIINPQLYINHFKLVDGTPTKNWKRALIDEQTSIQQILMKNLANQYTKPSWRLSGTWMAPDIKFTNILKHNAPGLELILVNPENPGSTGWTQSLIGPFPGGQAWTFINAGADAGKLQLIYDPSTQNASKFVGQPVANLVSGQRIRIDFKLERRSGDTRRIDNLFCVLLNGASVVQKVALTNGLQFPEVITRGISFNIDQDATHIGFMIDWEIYNSLDAVYYLDYFRLTSVASVRYYMINQKDRSDRANKYRMELVQLFPAVASTDPAVDDTGGGNTDGGETGNGGGNNGSSGFNGGFSTGYSGGFKINVT